MTGNRRDGRKKEQNNSSLNIYNNDNSLAIGKRKVKSLARSGKLCTQNMFRIMALSYERWYGLDHHTCTLKLPLE